MLRKSLYIIILLIPTNLLAQDGGKTIPFRLINNHIYVKEYFISWNLGTR
ncbi:MAG TPA: hypothetical protein VF476_08925 [Chitinophagaceae bacterium]